METVNYKLISSVNREILEAQATSEKLVGRLEKLSTNSNIKYLNFKVIGGALGIGLLLGALSVAGYSYYQIKNNIKIKKVPIIKTEQIKVKVKNPINKNLKAKVEDLKTQIEDLKSRVEDLKSRVLPFSYYYSDNDGSQYIGIKTTDPRFSKDDSNKSYTTYYIRLLK